MVLTYTNMKKFIIALTTLLTITASASAMSYDQAREQALFLTDKMAYELNLTDDQYEAAYEINLDYLMGINDYNDLYGAYWTQRNLDLSYILLDWQYNAYCAANYFYRPLYWDGGYWHFGIYGRYPHRDYFYFGRPDFILAYRGGHSWYHNGGHSWYCGRVFGGSMRNGNRRTGMRDEFNRGDYGQGTRIFGGRSGQQTRSMETDYRHNRVFGGRSYDSNGVRSSTRATVGHGGNNFFGDRSNNSQNRSTVPSRSFSPNRNYSQSSPTRSYNGPSHNSNSFGGKSFGEAHSGGFLGGRNKGGTNGGNFHGSNGRSFGGGHR